MSLCHTSLPKSMLNNQAAIENRVSRNNWTELAAQRELYGRAKYYLGLQITLLKGSKTCLERQDDTPKRLLGQKPTMI